METTVIKDPDDLKIKMIKIKKRLPVKWMQKLLIKFPELDSKESKNRIYNLVNLRITDQELMDKIESISL